MNNSKLQSDCPLQNHDIFKKGIHISHIYEKEKDNTTILFAFPQYIHYPNKTMFYIDFFTLFIDNSVGSLLWQELRDKNDLIYGAYVVCDIFPRASLLTIEISTKNNQILKVIRKTIRILKKIATGDFSQENNEQY